MSYDEKFTKKIIKIGKVTITLAIFLNFLPVLYIWLRHGAIPSISQILSGWLMIASMYGAFYIVEPISYFPILGLSGTYMSFLSGNIANVRVPSSALAQEVLEVESGSRKAELVSTISIAGSIITNLVILTIGAFIGSSLLNIMPDFVMKAFGFVFPTIMGALLAMFAVKYIKSALVGLVIGLIFNYTGIFPQWLSIPLTVFLVSYFTIKQYGSEN